MGNEDAGEQLWNYIERSKRGEVTLASDVATGLPPSEEDLLPLADVLLETLRETPFPPLGEIDARARLIEAIQQPLPMASGNRGVKNRFRLSRREASLLLVLLALTFAALIGYAIGLSQQRPCKPTEIKRASLPVPNAPKAAQPATRCDKSAL